jgi:hypothetical protein
VRADLTVTQTLRAGPWTAFEVSVRGTMHGRPFVQGLCLVFRVRAGRVDAFHEYLAWPGGLDPPTSARTRRRPAGPGLTRRTRTD